MEVKTLLIYLTYVVGLGLTMVLAFQGLGVWMTKRHIDDWMQGMWLFFYGLFLIVTWIITIVFAFDVISGGLLK